jgi:two-component system, sensor histidine kinase YesM
MPNPFSVFRRIGRKIGDFYINMSFRNKIIIIYIMTAIIPIAVLSSYSWYLLNNNIQNQSVKSMDKYLQQSAESINNNISRITGIVQTTGVDINIANAFYTDYNSYFDIYQAITYYIEPYFGSIKAFNPEVSNIYIITENKKFVDRAPSIICKDSITGKPWLDTAMTSLSPLWIYDTALLNNPDTGKPFSTLFCVRRVLGKSYGKSNNALYVEIKLDKLFNILKADQPNSGFIVTNSSGMKIYSSMNISSKLSEDDLNSLSSGTNSWENIGQSKWYISKKQLAIEGLYLEYFTSQSNFNANAGNILWLAVILFITSLLLTTLFMLYSSKVVVRRLDSLEAKAERIALGDFSVDLSSSNNDEIGKLTNIFGKMVSSIKELIDKVYKSELNSQEAEMKALQAQINPHFLYNVLSLINSMAIKERSFEISRLTTTISSYYRSMLSKDTAVIPIRVELENLKVYIEIQLILHNRQFDVVYDIDDEVYKYNTINIMLQPIVENAIEHGISILEDKRGKIEITAKILGSDVLFYVKDNGVGINQNEIDDVLVKKTKGYGLNNVQSRIKCLYGASYGLTISSETCFGTIIAVRIPCKSTISAS